MSAPLTAVSWSPWQTTLTRDLARTDIVDGRAWRGALVPIPPSWTRRPHPGRLWVYRPGEAEGTLAWRSVGAELYRVARLGEPAREGFVERFEGPGGSLALPATRHRVHLVPAPLHPSERFGRCDIDLLAASPPGTGRLFAGRPPRFARLRSAWTRRATAWMDVPNRPARFDLYGSLAGDGRWCLRAWELDTFLGRRGERWRVWCAWPGAFLVEAPFLAASLDAAEALAADRILRAAS